MCVQNSSAHPTGNMIAVNDRVYWSYIYPVEDVQHRACVMTWSVGEKPEIVLQSQYSASDFILYTNGIEIYIVERRYLQTEDAFECRVLKMKLGEKPAIIWDWFRDFWRVGEGGFFMLSDNQMVFANYPEVYTLEKGKEPVRYFLAMNQCFAFLAIH